MIKTNEPSVIKKEEVKEKVTISGACPFPYLKRGSKDYLGKTYKFFVRDPGKIVKEDDKDIEENYKENK